MAKRRQSRHDTTVRRVAGGYRSQRWKVKADISGYARPRTVYGKRFDVEATKGAKTRFVEVERPGSLSHRDLSQHRSFRRYAKIRPKTKFRIVRSKRRRGKW